MKSAPAGTTIILIDDNLQNLQVLAEVLSREFTTDLILARSGPEALEALAVHPVDLVLLDINMPDMDGFEVCRRLKSNDLLAPIPVIFLTSQHDIPSIVRGFEMGGADYIGKPFDARELTVRVRTQLELRKARQETQRLMDELVAANAKLEHLATTDGLMEIANRRFFNERLVGEWARAMRGREPLALIILDIDHFKRYNDQYGHLGGDGCLRQVADAIGSCVRRAGDLVARYGGEEIVLLLPATDGPSALVLAEKVRAAVWDRNLPHAASPVAPRVTISLGVAALVPEIGSKPETLVALADEALYRAKDAGRNRVQLA